MLRSVRIVVRDGRIPRPLRWAGAAGALPVPGPFDEILLLLVAAILWLFYRDQLREAWRSAASVAPPDAVRHDREEPSSDPLRDGHRLVFKRPKA